MPVKTYVFFDIETTGLPHQERNQTKITELTFIAVTRSDIEQADSKNLPPVNKLSLLFNPQRCIPSKVSQLTGLSNQYLKNQSVFTDKIKSINSFLELPKPVCLVAHNGNRFDYKILQAEYLDANATLPSDLLCVDSLSGFRNILKNGNIPNQNINMSLDSSVDNPDDWPDLDISLEDWEKIDNLVESFSNIMNVSKNGKKIKFNYTLSNLYKTLLGKNVVNAHRSEADCLMLLECVLCVKQDFLAWTDIKCKPISHIKPLDRVQQ